MDTRARLVVERPQTAWEVGKSLADKLGFLFFEAAGTLHFGSPEYLVRQGRGMQISWRGFTYTFPGAGEVYPALELPDCRATTRRHQRAAFAGLQDIDRLEDTTVKAKIERTTGERIRPGMRTSLAGVPAFESFGLLVTRVSWTLANLHDPVLVEAATAQVLAATERLPEDDQAMFDTPGPVTGVQRPQGERIGTANRIRYFGQPGDRVRAKTITVFGKQVTVHHAILKQFQAACDDAARSSRWRPVVIGSYVVRPVRGSSSPSLHGFGLAFDFYNKATVVTREEVWGPKHAPDAAFREAFKRHGFHLGAEFRGRKDYPHIEWASAPPG